jgi:uncharacterized protein YecE (DUF72 family)
MAGAIRTGIGGWVFPPWRGLFYPGGLRQADELSYASRHLGVIEINATSQSFQKPATFARWAEQTPDGFVFSVKAHRLCTNRKVLATAGDLVDRFVGQGLDSLGDRLGPLLWSFMPSKAFDPEDFAGFLELLPPELAGRPLRHVIEVRHASFVDPRFTEMCAARNAAICIVDHADYPLIDAATADFAYARLMRGSDDIETGYPPDQLDAWANRLRRIAGGEGGDAPRDAFAFFINVGKPRAPAAAMALAERVAEAA